MKMLKKERSGLDVDVEVAMVVEGWRIENERGEGEEIVVKRGKVVRV